MRGCAKQDKRGLEAADRRREALRRASGPARHHVIASGAKQSLLPSTTGNGSRDTGHAVPGRNAPTRPPAAKPYVFIRSFPLRLPHNASTLPRFNAASGRTGSRATGHEKKSPNSDFFLVPAAPFRHNIITFFDEHPGLRCDRVIWAQGSHNDDRFRPLGLGEAGPKATGKGCNRLLSRISSQYLADLVAKRFFHEAARCSRAVLWFSRTVEWFSGAAEWLRRSLPRTPRDRAGEGVRWMGSAAEHFGSKDMRVMGQSSIKCFVSHKCTHRVVTPDGKSKAEPHSHHMFIELLREVFRHIGIEIIKDPFGIGEEVGAKIRTVEYDTFLFLCCDDTLKSPACRLEREDAEKRQVAMFVVKWDGDVPPEYSKRIYVNWDERNGNRIDDLREMAAAIVVRGRLYRAIREIAQPGASAEEQRRLGMSICDESHPTAVAEFLSSLRDTYLRIGDATARFWIVNAIEATRDSRRLDILRSWLTEEQHPLPKTAIEEALSEKKKQEAEDRNAHCGVRRRVGGDVYLDRGDADE